MRDPNPVVILLPGIGRMTFAADKTTARLASEFYGNAINVMRGAEAIGSYVGLDEQEAFNIEYWALEEAKLQRMPKPKPLAGKIALVTGGAGGIGSATAERLLADGACVMLADRDAAAAGQVSMGLASRYRQGCRSLRGLRCHGRGTSPSRVRWLCKGVRRPGYCRRQCRHCVLRAGRENHARALAQEP